MIDKKHMDFDSLETKLGYKFNNHQLLIQSLTHKSAIGENYNHVDYQRLEFVGDAALGLFIAEQLFTRYPDADEGALTQWRANLVNRNYLANLAKKLKLSKFLQADNSQSNLKNNPNVLADVMESVIAAIFFDGGFKAVRKTLVIHYQESLDQIDKIDDNKDIKSRLQEFLHQRKWPLPIYENVMQSGPKHQPTFIIQIKIPSFHSYHELPVYSNFGEGNTRKEAERQAASKALLYLQSVDIIIEDS